MTSVRGIICEEKNSRVQVDRGDGGGGGGDEDWVFRGAAQVVTPVKSYLWSSMMMIVMIVCGLCFVFSFRLFWFRCFSVSAYVSMFVLFMYLFICWMFFIFLIFFCFRKLVLVIITFLFFPDVFVSLCKKAEIKMVLNGIEAKTKSQKRKSAARSNI